MDIVLAQKEDLVEITEIYNWAILETTATFDTIPKTLDQQISWFEKHQGRFPLLVAKTAGQVLGWVTLSPWSDRCAYSDTAEVSFYVKKEVQGRGIGRALLTRVDREAEGLRFHTLVSQIAAESKTSIHLHQSLGFEKVGVMREVGRKFDQLLDVYLMQKIFAN